MSSTIQIEQLFFSGSKIPQSYPLRDNNESRILNKLIPIMKNITIKSLRAEQESDPKKTEEFFKKPKDEFGDLDEKNHSRSKLKKFANFIVLFIFVLIVGGVGGILTDRFAIPYFLAHYPQFNRYEFLKKVNEHTTVVEVTKEVKISEDGATVEAIKKALPSVIQVVEPAENSNDKFIRKGAGVILTSDGIIITSAKNINITDEEKIKADSLKVELNNGKIYPAKLIAEDSLTGFAVIKIEENDLPVLAITAFDNIEVGEKIIALDDSVAVDIVSKFVDSGKTMKKRIKIMNSLNESFNGAPIINLKREIVGISQGGNSVVSMDEIMALVDNVVSKK